MRKATLELSFNWEKIGGVILDEGGKLAFPKTTSEPGLYRFDMDTPEGLASYIGEADQIARRLQHYRTPGPSQLTNRRLNDLMRSILLATERIALAIITSNVTVSLGGEKRDIDLTRKHDRVLLEHAALFEAHASGFRIVNA